MECCLLCMATSGNQLLLVIVEVYRCVSEGFADCQILSADVSVAPSIEDIVGALHLSQVTSCRKDEILVACLRRKSEGYE